ncbi:MAG: efflux RND transporter periplasmic adaptor subunit [Bacteroidetes bacterium]|nr:efflux RND transporter periplasmic adaptor subunit [Bacteroidota bacterium]
MKRIHLIPVLLIPALLASCGKKESKKFEVAERIEPVKTLELGLQEIARSVEYTATLMPFEELHLAPSSPGRIERISVEVSSRVRKGDLLVQMDQTQLRQAEIQLATLETDFRRLDTLRKVGSVAQQQYDQLKSQLEVLRNNVAFLRENTQLRAPFAGIISGKYFENGEVYTGAPVPSVGKPAIVSLVQINQLKALVPVSEKYFPLIRRGIEANVRSDVYAGQQFKGRVTNIFPVVDQMSRTFQIEVTIDNAGELLRPGMFVRVTLDLDRDNAMLVPDIAVLKLQGSNDRYLFVEENGVARRIAVKLGKRYNEMVEVESDQLKPGQKLIVSGQARLLDGSKVQVVNN